MKKVAVVVSAPDNPRVHHKATGHNKRPRRGHQTFCVMSIGPLDRLSSHHKVNGHSLRPSWAAKRSLLQPEAAKSFWRPLQGP
jgi:hypothetical protein